MRSQYLSGLCYSLSMFLKWLILSIFFSWRKPRRVLGEKPWDLGSRLWLPLLTWGGKGMCVWLMVPSRCAQDLRRTEVLGHPALGRDGSLEEDFKIKMFWKNPLLERDGRSARVDSSGAVKKVCICRDPRGCRVPPVSCRVMPCRVVLSEARCHPRVHSHQDPMHMAGPPLISR